MTQSAPKNLKKKKKNPADVRYTATAARASFYSILSDVTSTYTTYEVTQRQADPVVVLSKEKYEKLLKWVPEKELRNGSLLE